MKLNGQDHFCRKSVKRCSFHEAEELPLARSPLRRSRAPSIERCPTRHARARHAGPATVLPALPPRSRLPAPRSPPPGSRRGRLDPPRDPGLITLGRAGQTPPVDFCNHHGSQARPRTLTHLPCAPCKGYTLARRDGRQPCICGASAGRAVSVPGASMVFTSTPAPLRAIARRRALPRTGRPGHLMSRKHARDRPDQPDAEVRDNVPMVPPTNNARGAVRARAHAPLPSATKVLERAPEVPSVRMDGPEAGAAIHKLLPACGLVARRLLSCRMLFPALTCHQSHDGSTALEPDRGQVMDEVAASPSTSTMWSVRSQM